MSYDVQRKEQIAKQKALKKAAKQKGAAEPRPQLPQSLNMAALVPQRQHSRLRSRQATEVCAEFTAQHYELPCTFAIVQELGQSVRIMQCKSAAALLMTSPPLHCCPSLIMLVDCMYCVESQASCHMQAASVSPRDFIPTRSRSRATLDDADLAAMDELGKSIERDPVPVISQGSSRGPVYMPCRPKQYPIHR